MTSSPLPSPPANLKSIIKDLRRQQRSIQADIVSAQTTLQHHLDRYENLNVTIDSLLTRISTISVSSSNPESTSPEETYLDNPEDIRNNIRFKTLIPRKLTYYPLHLRSKLQPITTAPERGDLLVILNKYKPAHVGKQTQWALGVVSSVSGQKVELSLYPSIIVIKKWPAHTVAKIDSSFTYPKAFPPTK